MKNKNIIIQNWGIIDYQEALSKQYVLKNEIIAIKSSNNTQKKNVITPNYLIFCEHPPTYTIGRSGNKEDFLANEKTLIEEGVQLYEVRRGGAITFHGLGQLVVYFIWDLENFYTDLHLFLRQIETTIIETLKEFNINSERYEGYTGVWIDIVTTNARKICAMGLHCTKWVTSHGIALNVNTDLSFFDKIVPCGIKDKFVTSIYQETRETIAFETIITIFLKKLQINFHIVNYEK